MTSATDNNLAEIKLAIYNFEKRLNIFHVGIFVHGKEFHYGVRQGVAVCNPRNGGKVFRVMVYNKLPRKMAFLKYVNISLDGVNNLCTALSFEQLLRVKASLESARFGPDTYRLFHNNCIDFALQFLRIIAQNGQHLGEKILPKEIQQPWITKHVRKIEAKINQNKKKHILQLPIH